MTFPQPLLPTITNFLEILGIVYGLEGEISFVGSQGEVGGEKVCVGDVCEKGAQRRLSGSGRVINAG